MQAFNFPLDHESLECFVAFQLYKDALEHIEPPYTKEKLVAYVEGLKNYKFKGLTLTFDPKTRGLSQPLYIKNELGEVVPCGKF